MQDILHVIGRHAGNVPVPVFGIVMELGLGPDFLWLDDDVSGWFERKPTGEYRIAVNLRHPLTRQRFTAAHELGHYIYHRDLLGDGVGDARAYRAVNSPRPNPKIRPIHERQANSFAANLLMPRALIAAAGTNDPVALAQRFGVSEEAMRLRLGEA
jgi:Zn-dependent peptidase ImmA (M78 family)